MDDFPFVMAQGKLKAKVKVPGKSGEKQKNPNKKNLGLKKGPKDLKAKKQKAVVSSQRQKEITKGINKAIEAELVGKARSCESTGFRVIKGPAPSKGPTPSTSAKK